MPAPQATQFQNFITAALLGRGFIKREYQNGKLITYPSQLPDKLADMVAGFSNGEAQNWALWQASQTVVGTAPPPAFTIIPGTGKLP